MARSYRQNAGTRVITWVFTRLTQAGMGASYRHLLTVRGRKTGQPRTTPVDAMDIGGQRWLVVGYGPANWVHNARAAGEVTLSRGGREVRYAVAEPAAGEAVPVLRKYLTEIRVTRPYFDATPRLPRQRNRSRAGPPSRAPARPQALTGNRASGKLADPGFQYPAW